ncbi:hypothetical protein NHJ13734_002803 [Beauveria thailandica]
MAKHLHSTLSDEGIEDNELRNIELLRHRGPLSQASTGPRSSPARDNFLDGEWQLEGDAPLHEFSSARQNDGQLPETAPIPSQLVEIRDAPMNATRRPARLDLSETCSTTRRSTPCSSDDFAGPWDFVSVQSDVSHLSASEETEEPAGPAIDQPNPPQKGVVVPSKRKSEQQQKRPYNTRAKPKISYADGESSSDEENEPEVVAPPETAARASAKKSTRKMSPAKDNAAKPAKKPSPKKQGPEKRDESAIPRVRENKKRRQRRKTPLPIDEETQTVPTTLPATPPVSDQRPKKQQKYQTRKAPAETRLNPCSKNSGQENTPSAARPNTSTSPKLGSDQPLHVPSSVGSEDMRASCLDHSPLADIVQDDEDQDVSSMVVSVHSTEMTTPGALPSPKLISSIQAPVPSYQPLPRPMSPALVFENVKESIESIPIIRPAPAGDLSLLMSRNVSRRDEEIGHRLQEIHKRIVVYLESKEKEVASVGSVYLKNGTRCVDRLQNRFAKERHSLLRRLQEDKDAFDKTIGAAKRGLREGARERQRVLKELDRNANKRRHSCTNESNYLGCTMVGTAQEDTPLCQGNDVLTLTYHMDIELVKDLRIFRGNNNESTKMESRRLLFYNLPPSCTALQVARTAAAFGQVLRISEAAPAVRGANDGSLTMLIDFATSESSTIFESAVVSTCPQFISETGELYGAGVWVIPTPSFPVCTHTDNLLQCGLTRTISISPVANTHVWFIICAVAAPHDVLDAEHDGTTQALTLEFAGVDIAHQAGEYLRSGLFDFILDTRVVHVGPRADRVKYGGYLEFLPADHLKQRFDRWPFNQYWPETYYYVMTRRNLHPKFNLNEGDILASDATATDDETNQTLSSYTTSVDNEPRGRSLLPRDSPGTKRQRQNVTELLASGDDPQLLGNWDTFFQNRSTISLREWEEYGKLAKHRRELSARQGLADGIVPRCDGTCELDCKDITETPRPKEVDVFLAKSQEELLIDF